MAWRPPGEKPHQAPLRTTTYRSGELSLDLSDLKLTSTGRAMTLHQRVSPSKLGPVQTRRSLQRRALDDFADPAMATARREGGRQYWHRDEGFNMYETTTGTVHGPKSARADPLLQHPEYRRAPLSEKMNYVDSYVARPMTEPGTARRRNLQSETHREYTVPQESNGRQLVADRGMDDVLNASTLFDTAARPLVTMEPSELPFGKHIRESETAAEFRIPPRDSSDAITFYRDHPDQALNLNDRERAIYTARAPAQARPQTSPGSLRPPQTFRPLYKTGMRTSNQDTYRDPALTTTAQYEQPPNYVYEVATRPLSESGKPTHLYDVPKMYEATNQTYGENKVSPPKGQRNYDPVTHISSAVDTRPLTARADPARTATVGFAPRPTTAPSENNGGRWRKQVAMTGERFGAPLDAETEYKDAYHRESYKTKPHHMW